MSGPGLAAVIVAVCAVAFAAGVLVGRGPLRSRREAKLNDIVGQAVEAAREQMHEEAQQASSSIEQKAVAIEAGLRSVSDGVTAIQTEAASRLGSLDSELRGVAETNRRLSRVLDKPTSRGDLGEWLVEQMLQSAGFREGHDYEMHRQLPGGGIPDFSIRLPQGRRLHVDAKMPHENLQRYVDASESAEKDKARRAFVRDVDKMVHDLADRGYADEEDSVDAVVLCVPNDNIYALLLEADRHIVDRALKRGIVLCSISTLFAVLAVVRQAVKNFQLETRTGEVLQCLDEFRQEWGKFAEQVDTTDRRLAALTTSWDALKGARSNKLSKTIERIHQIEHDNAQPATSSHASSDEPHTASN